QRNQCYRGAEILSRHPGRYCSGNDACGTSNLCTERSASHARTPGFAELAGQVIHCSPMKLHWSTRSPYVRKVMVAAIETGTDSLIEPVSSFVSLSTANPDVLADNPLGKIPTL